MELMGEGNALIADINPMVNQVEYHPHLAQTELLDFCKAEDIQLEAWSPLKHGELLSEPPIVEIAERHKKSPAQIILRWDLQNGVVTIPKSNKSTELLKMPIFSILNLPLRI